MKQSVMKKWVEALRSGKYEQTREVLKGDDGYCCLGVLCDISKKGEWTTKCGQNDYDCGSLDKDDVNLPVTVQKWAEMKNNTGKADIHTSLTVMNDDDRMNFKEIADFIETNWKKL